MTEARKGSCSNPVRFEEEIEPNQCQSMASEPSTGRMLFRGVDMVFLTVNGHQMLTLHEILEKLLPTTPRSTFCARIAKLNALRHVCTKHETQKIKALGGAKASAIKCTVIARKHVVEYCEKYNLQNASQIKSSSEGINVKLSGVKNVQGNGKTSSIRNQFFTKSDDSSAAVDEAVFASQPVLEDLVQCGSIINANDTENIGNAKDVGETHTETKVLGKENGNSEKRRNVRFKKQNIRYSKLSNSGVMSCWSGAISQRRNINQRSQQRAPKPSQVLKKRGRTVSSNDFVRKRKRNLELVQSSCGKIVDDNGTAKRQKMSHHPKGNQGRTDAKGGHEEPITYDSSSLDFSSSFSLTLATFNTSTEQSHGQSLQAFNDEEFNADVTRQTAKCYLDDNNNNNEIKISNKPLSPTLLLKRSLNNEWHVAKSRRLARLNFDTDENATINGDDTERFLACAAELTRKAHSAINFTNTSRISNDASGGLATDSTVPKPSATLTSKVKKSVDFVSTKKNGRIKGKKSETRIAFKSHEKESNTPNQIKRFGSDAQVKEKNSGAKFIGNCCSGGVKIFAEPNRSVNNSNGKSLARRDAETKGLAKDKTNGLQQPAKTNKTNGGIVTKQKRRRRVQLNTFRLIETIPYPSLLVVKDGDLCPSYTMTYSAEKYLPHCCHPLWRWHLGKPILHPK